MHIVSVAEMKALEAAADAAGHTYARMMELAGQHVARAILKRLTVKGRRALILVGPGNNGGDGLVAARYLAEAGATVTVYLSRARDAGKDEVYRKAVERGLTVVVAANDPECRELRRLTSQCHLLVDALLGTGATPPLEGAIAELLQAAGAVLENGEPDPLTWLTGPQEAQRNRPHIVAVDGPSGMDFDTGDSDPRALRADLTVAFAYPKTGHFRFPAAGQVGELVVADIGIPADVARQIPLTGPMIVTPQQVAGWLPARPANAHKGDFGKALLVAGSANYTGAAALAASAAVRAGAGLVTLGLASSLHSAIAPQVPEATYLLLPNALGALTPDAAPLLQAHWEGYTALLLGPGLSQAEETGDFVRAFFGARTEKRAAGFLPSEAASPTEHTAFPPLIVDADGLNLLAQLPDWPQRLPAGSILTPHPGEMARLCGCATADVQAARETLAKEKAAAWGQVVVLKGAFTVVAAPDGRVALLPFANAGLASAGTGDVLAGAITALRAQGLAAFEAAVAGTYLHGLAGELARKKHGAAGMAASDVVAALPEAWRRLSLA